MTMHKAPFLLDNATTDFPDVNLALAEPNGLLALGGDLSADRLLSAYKNGIFPWYEEGQPIMWWSPNPRMILRLDDFYVSKSLAKAIRKPDYTVTADTAFKAVVSACAAPRQGDDEPGTWITQDIIEAYQILHEQGYGHSVEIWKNDKLIGGVYGLSIGQNFFAESMFSREANASKIALYYLVNQLARSGFKFIDCQVWSEHLESLGAMTIPRNEFINQVKVQLTSPTNLGNWTINRENHR